MSVNLENYEPDVMQNGLNTSKAVSLGSTLTVTGVTTLNGNVTLGTSSVFSGGKANVISGQGATATLTAAQSGSTVLFDRAAGIVYTLPVPTVGIWFEFIVTTTITSNNAEIDTDSGSTFLMGGIELIIGASATTLGCAGNGTSHVKVQMNGTTKGGILGSQLLFTAVSSTQWNVTGIGVGSGTLATPFA